MTIQRMDHVGIVVDDLADAVAFFVELGLELQGEAPVEGDRVDRVVGLEGVRAQIAVLRTPGGHRRLELTKFHTPSTDGSYQAAAWDSLGYTHHHLGCHTQAVISYQRALGLYRELGNRYYQADTLTHLGDVQYAAKDLKTAARG
jgi:catechol 2,3-dioxygenase-like lactoylglutathione lyase family enzyme